jgi:hypothetical protein
VTDRISLNCRHLSQFLYGQTILKLFDRKEVRQMAAINMRTTQLTLVKGCGFLKLGNQLREKLL